MPVAVTDSVCASASPIDGKLPNLALMRLAHYHRARGDEVHFTRHVERQPGEPTYDRVYGSAIFAFSADRVAQFRQHFPDAIVGGTYTVLDYKTVEQLLGVTLLRIASFSIPSPTSNG